MIILCPLWLLYRVLKYLLRIANFSVYGLKLFAGNCVTSAWLSRGAELVEQIKPWHPPRWTADSPVQYHFFWSCNVCSHRGGHSTFSIMRRLLVNNFWSESKKCQDLKPIQFTLVRFVYLISGGMIKGSLVLLMLCFRAFDCTLLVGTTDVARPAHSWYVSRLEEKGWRVMFHLLSDPFNVALCL